MIITRLRPCILSLFRYQINTQFIRSRRFWGFDERIESVDPINKDFWAFGRKQETKLRPQKYSEVELWMLDAYPDPLIISPIPHRQAFGVSGDGSKSLINGLITNDIALLDDKEKNIFTYALNNKGRILYEMMIYRFSEVAPLLDSTTIEKFSGTDENYVIECDYRQMEEIVRHIRIYKLRRKIRFIKLEDLNLFSIFPTPYIRDVSKFYKIFHDPRHSRLGSRIFMRKEFAVEEHIKDLIHVPAIRYRDFLNQMAIPEGPLDIPPGKYFPLDFSVDLMNGISFSKGCYLGQELTTRTFFTGKIRKRILSIRWTIYNIPMIIEPGYEVVDCMDMNYKKVGTIVNFHNLLCSGLALIDYRVMRSVDRIPAVRIPPKKIEQIALYPPSWWTREQFGIFDYIYDEDRRIENIQDEKKYRPDGKPIKICAFSEMFMEKGHRMVFDKSLGPMDDIDDDDDDDGKSIALEIEDSDDFDLLL